LFGIRRTVVGSHFERKRKKRRDGWTAFPRARTSLWVELNADR
jgi:hypothetical protein